MWLVVISIILLIYFLTRKPNRFPPGPPCLPIIGSVPFMKMQHIHLWLQEVRARYGPIIGAKLALKNAVFFCAPTQVMEVFKMDVFQGRPQKIAISSNRAKRGIILTEGSFWSSQRRFTLRHLRDFGFGKTSIEGAIMEEIDDFFQSSLYGVQEIQAANLFNTSSINVLLRIMAGKRYQHNDAEFQAILKALHDTFRDGGFTRGAAFLRRYFRSLLGCPEKIECEEFLINFLEKTIEDHRQTRTAEPRDFIDVYLQEIESTEDKNFNELTMISICLDLFSAGAESVGNTLSFCLLYLVLYPEVQKELFEEVDGVLEGRSPVLSDRSRLPHFEAFLSEVARINTIAPIAVPRRTLDNVTYQGYNIPKDTFVVLSLWAVMMDKEHWGDPEVFRPERFLDENGRYLKDDWLINFGIGKRHCPGESLAKNTLFLFLVKLVQEFEFGLPSGAEMPSTLGLSGFTAAPQPFIVSLRKRIRS